MKAAFFAAALTGLTFVVGAAAQTAPAAYLERSQVLPSGSVIHAYRVPTTDINGKVRYSDLEITLDVNDAGKVAGSAAVVAAPSPRIQGNNFIVGTYRDANGATTCTVGASLLPSGRQQASINCVNSVNRTLAAAWATGDITGHPFELDLRAAGIDQIPGYRDFAWGKMGEVTQTQYWGCMSTGEIVSAVQTGNQLVLNGYDRGNVQLCGVALNLQP